MEKFQGSIKKEVEFPGVFKKNSCRISMGLSFFIWANSRKNPNGVEDTMEFSKAELLKKEHVEIPGSWANYSKQHINLVFNGLHQRTYQYVHRCIRENTMEYFLKNLNYVIVF